MEWSNRTDHSWYPAVYAVGYLGAVNFLPCAAHLHCVLLWCPRGNLFHNVLLHAPVLTPSEIYLPSRSESSAGLVLRLRGGGLGDEEPEVFPEFSPMEGA